MFHSHDSFIKFSTQKVKSSQQLVLIRIFGAMLKTWTVKEVLNTQPFPFTHGTLLERQVIMYTIHTWGIGIYK